MEDKILKLVEEKVIRTSLGFPIIELANLLNLELKDLKITLNEMRKKGLIVARKGINDKLIYKK